MRNFWLSCLSFPNRANRYNPNSQSHCKEIVHNKYLFSWWRKTTQERSPQLTHSQPCLSKNKFIRNFKNYSFQDFDILWKSFPVIGLESKLRSDLRRGCQLCTTELTWIRSSYIRRRQIYSGTPSHTRNNRFSCKSRTLEVFILRLSRKFWSKI